MIISPREKTDGRPAPGTRARDEAAVDGDQANRLNEDEWEFLRATPDFDAEEMSSASLPSLEYRAPANWDSTRRVAPEPVESSAESPGEFPEVGSLAEMLDDLLEKPREGAADPTAATATWGNVPAAAEWATLMESEQSPAGAVPGQPRTAAPAVRDVLMDALAAGERIGLLPGPEAR